MNQSSQKAKTRHQVKFLGKNPALHRVLTATLSLSGAWLLLPFLAAQAQTAPLTAAGAQIRNTATATYEDSNNPGTTINATSNTVTATVAEVAGITNVGVGISDSTPTTPVLPNDTLTYDFLITNAGNDTTKISIPAPIVTGPGTLQSGGITYDIDKDGDGVYETTGKTPSDYTTLYNANDPSIIIKPGGSIKVHVPVKVDLSATSGAPIKVQLGDTGLNDNLADTQNQPVSGALSTNVQTVDAPDGTTGETTGAPVNGEREASAYQQILVGATPQAFAAILKTYGAVVSGADFTNYLVTYNLALRVDSAAPTGVSPSLTPADLTGTSITVDTVTAPKVLVSDAIPANTVLNAAPTAPLGWTVVYTTSPTSTFANLASWTATAPANLTTVTRVGFIKDGPIAKGTTVPGFSFQVKTTGLNATTGGTVYNIAQLFGTSVGGTTLVYDESGDQNPSNFNDDGSTGPGPTNGVANPANDGTDSNNNNTGTGPGGEDSSLTLAPAGAIFNGPKGNPAAIGPTDNNDDFTNQSTPIAAGTTPGSLINPDLVTFTNTISAPTTQLNNVLVRPLSPSTITGGAAGDVPTGTTATLTYEPLVGAIQIAVYTYDGTQFGFTSGSAIQIPTIPAGSSVNYKVTIDLPANTALSTDTGKGYPVPILAFADSGNGTAGTAGNGVLDSGEAFNKTIDRVYTGFLKLVKRSKVLKGTGPVPSGANAALDTNPKTPEPGNIIQYEIEYTNISTAAVGAGNLILDAKNVVITESGVLNTAVFPAAPNGNNWGQDYDGNGKIDTSHVIGSATDSGTGFAITFFAGTTAGTSVTEQTGITPTTDITKYVDTLSVPVNPGTTRTFSFQRKIN